MDTKVEFSPIETNILGIKVGRCNSDFFNAVELYDLITKNSYDLCRLKIPAEDEMASYRLDATGLPFYFSGSIRRYKTRITENPADNYNFPDLAFEMYDGTQDQLLKDMLIGTWGMYPIGYYRTPYLCNLVTKENEIECVFQYYRKFNLRKDYPDNCIMFIKHGDLYVGFFALNTVGNTLESHIGGILEPYRKSGYFLDKLHYIKEFCVKNNLKHFVFGARNENAEVQRIFQFVGFEARGTENVFHIPSLLGFSQKSPIEIEINFNSNDLKGIYQILLDTCLNFPPVVKARFNKVAFQLNRGDLLINHEKCKVRFSFPVLSAELTLIVLGFDAVNNILPTGYFRISR